MLVRKARSAVFLSSFSTTHNAVNWICREAEASQDNDGMKTQVARYLEAKLSCIFSARTLSDDLTITTILKWCLKLGLLGVFQKWLATVAIEIPMSVRRWLALRIAGDSSRGVDDWDNW